LKKANLQAQSQNTALANAPHGGNAQSGADGGNVLQNLGTQGSPNSNSAQHPEAVTQNPAGMTIDPSIQRATAHPWEFVDEISNMLKTASPLLTPSLEILADNVATRFKPTPEEEIYRFIIALLSEGLHVSRV
jgi:transformation/transcription domain-associated protein